MSQDIAELVQEMQAMRSALEDLQRETQAIKEVIQAWEFVKTGGKLVTWLAKFGAGVVGLILLLKGISTGLVDLGSRP